MEVGTGAVYLSDVRCVEKEDGAQFEICYNLLPAP